MDRTSRRDFLRRGWKLGGAFLFGAGAYTGYEALRPLATSAGGAKLKVGTTASFAEGTTTYVPEGRMYVVNASNYLFALSGKCPHLGATYRSARAPDASSARATARCTTLPASTSRALRRAAWIATASRCRATT